jgi:pyrimidine-nucleoside phosphorylase
MRAVELIIKKRDKGEFTTEEIHYFVTEYTAGNIPDYQASALAMAILLNGMTHRETTDLTLAMVNSGDTLDLSEVVELAVDKHSTGGVGDKTTLVVEPLVAACGVPVGKMSGRGLGFSGGTLDKMESVPGFRVDLTQDEFLEQLDKIGLVLTGQTGDLAPADGKLYALRDVTGTVPSLALIASSIMSKKIAAGAQRIVLDVKTGVGAFMKTVEDARTLAEMMVEIGRLAGRRTAALISDMNQPLGFAVGNALEVVEAIETLQGNGPDDFRDHAFEVAAYMLTLAEKVDDVVAARQMVADVLASGKAWEKFRELVAAQGGDVSYVDHPEKLPAASLIETVTAPHGGYLSEVNARIVGETAVALGAGREKKGQPIDHAVGIVVHHNVGDQVEAGQPLFTIHANQQGALDFAREELLSAHVWSDTPVDPLPLFYEVVL